MDLYIINCEINNSQAQYLLERLTRYNGQVCNIVEINNTNVQDINLGYLSELTIGKLQHQLNKDIMYYIYHDFDENDVIYYLVQTQQIKIKDIWYKICKFNASKCLQVLFDQGINVDIQDNYGEAPLHNACCYNSVESVKLLFDHGSNVNIQDNFGGTPLHWACYKDSVETVKLLTLNKANVNIQDNYGSTPLHRACWNNRVECAKLLIFNGANVNILDNDGETPLQLALERKSTECIRLLQNHKRYY